MTMRTVPFNVFREPEVRKFNTACERYGLVPDQFSVVGFLSEDGPIAPIIRVRVEYLPTAKAAYYLCGDSMSWLVSFEIDLGTQLFTKP